MARTLVDRRTAGLSGLVFLALFVSHRILQGPGPLQGEQAAQPSARAIVAYVADRQSVLFVAEFVNTLGVLALLIFAASVAGTVRRAGGRAMADVVLGGGVLFAALAMVTTALQTALVATAGEVDAGTLRLLFDVQGVVPITMAIAFFVGAISVAALVTGVLPRWTCISGTAVAVVLLIGAAAQAHLIGGGFFAPKGQAALVGAAVFLGWALAACLGLLRPRRHLPQGGQA